MLNLMRADLYRLFHGRTLWLTLAALSLFCLFAGSGRFSPIFRVTFGGRRVEQVSQVTSGAQAPFALMASPEYLIYFFLPVLLVIACSDFSTGAIQNTLSKGHPRSRVYLARLILSSFIAVVFALFGIVLPLISGTLLLGFGMPLTVGYFEKLAVTYLLQLPLFLGIISLGILLAFLMRKLALVAAIYLVLFTAAWLAVTVLPAVSGPWATLLNGEILFNLEQAVSWPVLSPTDIIRIASLGIVYVLITTGLGVFIFQRSDISRKKWR